MTKQDCDHDYATPIRKGRAHFLCSKCYEDITLDLVWLAEADENAEGVKYDQDKLRIDLLPLIAVEELAKVLSYGAKKYTPDNWRKGMVWSRLFGATLRHLFAWWRGKDLDEESGLPHIAHALCCVAFLAEYHTTRKEFDDRIYKER